MDMKAAGSGLMGGIAHTNRFPQEGLPGHIVLMVLQAHRMGDNFKAILQRAIMFAINAIGLSISFLYDVSSVGGTFPSAVNFQFYAEVSGAFAPKRWGQA